MPSKNKTFESDKVAILKKAITLYIKEEARELSRELNPHRQLQHINCMDLAREILEDYNGAA